MKQIVLPNGNVEHALLNAEVRALRVRIRDLEQHNEHLQHENDTLKKKLHKEE